MPCHWFLFGPKTN